MSDPLFDALLASDPYTATTLPAPLQPSRAATPLGIHSNTSTTPFRSPTSNDLTKDIEAERRADEAEALFDPLQAGAKPPPIRSPKPGLQVPANQSIKLSLSVSSSPQLQPQTSPHSRVPSAPSGLLGDLLQSSQTKSSFPTSSTDASLASATSSSPLFAQSTSSRTARPVPAPLLPPAQRLPIGPLSAVTPPFQDDFGAFVSVADPLAIPDTFSPTQSPPASTSRITFDAFTNQAKERHAAAQRRVLDHFENGEQAIGVDAWMDAQEQGTAEEEAEDRASEEADDPEEGFEFDFVQRDMGGEGGEEGPISPPATPIDDAPPAMHRPPAYAQMKHVDTKSLGPASHAPNQDHSSDLTPKVKHTKSQTPDAPPTGTATNTGGGLSVYFTNTLPRKWTLTGLIAGSPPLPVPAPPQISPTSEERWVGPAEGSLGSATEALSSSIPPRRTHLHARPSHGSGANSLRGGKGGPPLDAYLTHTTPFGSTPYIPPSGAPGFEGDRQWDKGGFADDWDKGQAQEKNVKVVKGKGVNLFGRNEMTAGVVTMGLACSIRSALPPLARLSDSWQLLYSMDQHGISLHTLFTRCEPSYTGRYPKPAVGTFVPHTAMGGRGFGRKGAILVVRDSEDGVFGAWIGDGVHMSGGHMYGGGDSFLWKAIETIIDPKKEEAIREDEEVLCPTVKVFKWTGMNDYVALCEKDSVSFGGGEDGKTGLYLSSTLLEGSSAQCITFNNDVLCGEPGVNSGAEGKTTKFEVMGLEVWGLGG